VSIRQRANPAKGELTPRYRGAAATAEGKLGPLQPALNQ
jgi:hypothetical protein